MRTSFPTPEWKRRGQASPPPSFPTFLIGNPSFSSPPPRAPRITRHHRSTPRRRRITRLAALALPALLCGVAAMTPAVPAQRLADGIAAIVNADVIMLSDLRAAMADELVRLKARYDGEEFEKHLAQKQHEALNRMIERTLQLQEAAAKNITVTPAEVDEAWEKVQQNPDAVPAGVTPSREVVLEEMTLQRLMEFEVQRRIIVPFEEIRAYYREQEPRFTMPPTHRLRQILLTPKLDERMAAVRKRAESLEAQLRDGADFAELAAVYSDGPARDKGGDLEFVRKEDLLTPLRAALDDLAPGERSPVIETDIGMHILLRGETRQGAPQPFDDVKELIQRQLYQQKVRDARAAWLSSLKDRSYVDIRL